MLLHKTNVEVLEAWALRDDMGYEGDFDGVCVPILHDNVDADKIQASEAC